ncbi:acyltransferase family protein [Bacteroides sedimenti]|uniref:Acyltransferase 3 domain-containing protein n=1 Tax=Bacteroides sedimenti TaxID=2136147 RepID=A0ABN6Z2Q0_9BACE
MGKRIYYLDLIKFFAIYIVILGHAIQYIGKGFWHNPLWELIYSFHMALFMIMSGYFFSSSMKLSAGAFFKKKSVQLLLPAVAWYSFLCLVYSFINPGLEEENIMKFDMHGLVNSFWFLKCVFGCYFIARISLKLIKNEFLAAIISSVVLCIVPFGSLVAINFLLPFFWIGLFYKKYREKIEKDASLWWGASLALFIFCLACWEGSYTIYKSPIELFSFHPFHFATATFGIALFRFLIGLAGSAFFIISVQMLYERYANRQWISKCCEIGKYTLGIYIIQMILFERVFMLLSLRLDDWLVYLLAPGLSLAILALCLTIIKTIERNSYSRFLLLGTPR